MTSDATSLTAHAAPHADTHGSGGIGNPVLGMLLFIASEIMFFAGLFAAYFTLRAGYTETVNGTVQHLWPPTTPIDFSHILNPFTLLTENGSLNLILPATIVLVVSSITCQMGVWSIKKDDHRGFVRNFAVTLILGIMFLGMQLYDYTVLYSEELTLDAGPFGTTYYTLTGFHGAHVFGGALMLAVVVYRGMAGQFSAKHHDMVEATSLYWHFVDVVWILLFSILYLL